MAHVPPVSISVFSGFLWFSSHSQNIPGYAQLPLVENSYIDVDVRYPGIDWHPGPMCILTLGLVFVE